MKTYKKELLKLGLSPKLVSSLSESQGKILFNKLVLGEQDGTVTIGAEKLSQQDITNKISDMTKRGMNVRLENEDDEEFGDKVLNKYSKGEMGEESNPWAICTSQLGDEFGTTKRSQWSAKEKAKFERCVKQVKESLKEGKNSVSLFLENQITKIVEKNLPPRITKGELVKYLIENKPKPSREKEGAPVIAPNKPSRNPVKHPGKKPFEGPNPEPKAKKTEAKENTRIPQPSREREGSPVIAPSKPRTSPNPVKHPGKKPFEGPNPDPKAKSKVDPEMAKDSVINTIMNIIKK
jgi:hypothetical protein